MTTTRTPLRRAVLNAPTRHALARVVVWRPGMTDVPVDRLLLGAQNGMSASDFAAALGDPLWASRRVAEGPHAELLALGREGELSDAAVLASSYGRMARVCT